LTRLRHEIVMWLYRQLGNSVDSFPVDKRKEERGKMTQPSK
jgi:hypothetical protein